GIAFTLSGMLGLRYVRKKLNRPLKIITKKFLGDYFLALTVLDVAIVIYKFLMPYNPDSRLLIRALWVLGVIILSAITYSITTMRMNFDEWKLLKQAFGKKKK
ncbi:MAG: hypothetical protein IJQ47_09895, partial [Synergistaceae bacterium]|nr:hypothetical protein [Synergistaceae bacterium]